MTRIQDCLKLFFSTLGFFPNGSSSRISSSIALRNTMNKDGSFSITILDYESLGNDDIRRVINFFLFI